VRRGEKSCFSEKCGDNGFQAKIIDLNYGEAYLVMNKSDDGHTVRGNVLLLARLAQPEQRTL
jgi:hypothetical protein